MHITGMLTVKSKGYLLNSHLLIWSTKLFKESNNTPLSNDIVILPWVFDRNVCAVASVSPDS
uniref:Uncharacterized protein n=1 Tax=Anguilla anguilla TaxID=7936 RepID=A0A0E9SL01_ANGAN